MFLTATSYYINVFIIIPDDLFRKVLSIDSSCVKGKSWPRHAEVVENIIPH